MKILFVSESYYPYQSGVPMVVKYLAEGLAVDNDIMGCISGVFFCGTT